MKLLFRKISSIVLALTLMFSTTSFTVEKHFCGEFLVDISFLGDANACGGEKEDACKGEAVTAKTDCCKDELLHLEGIDDLGKVNNEKISFEQQKYFWTTNINYQLLLLEKEKEHSNFKNYLPPEIVINKQVLYEVYII